ncbi:E3 ubiquitin-protein ligase TRIM39-like [Astyanax mexicanus]|uniref:E3 ubiquitin-protein ligase TRIM39-like n=1 Tax=Astyanax mexicanus TaxID=7994 RepID=UPI0020CAFA60|nr:E3 ubiquitin-protein ligase TRIM39-like [Astyanax mexicanus]
MKCCICEVFLKQPTPLPCGHNFCLDCITREKEEMIYEENFSCPKCSMTFETNPELTINKTMKSVRSKVQCGSTDNSAQTSVVAELKGKLGQTKAKEDPQVPLCPRHKKILQLYCIEDKKCVCEECTEHRSHDITPADKERKEREKKVEKIRRKARREIHERELILQKISQNFENIKSSSQSALEANQIQFIEMISSLERMMEDLNKTIKEKKKELLSQAQSEERQQRSAIQSLQETITDLESLSQIKEDIHYIKKSESIICRQEERDTVLNHVNDNISFEFVKKALEHLKLALKDECELAVDIIQDKVACPLTLDPNTAHPNLSISDDNTKMTVSAIKIKKKNVSAQRFDRWAQVLCKEDLRGGRFYWEVEWSGMGAFIGVVREDFPRNGAGLQCGLGRNPNSWCLQCSNTTHYVWHNNSQIVIPAKVVTPRIGLCLDHTAGRLEFYAVSDKMTLLYSFPLEKGRYFYPAFGLGLDLQLHSSIRIPRLENS